MGGGVIFLGPVLIYFTRLGVVRSFDTYTVTISNRIDDIHFLFFLTCLFMKR